MTSRRNVIEGTDNTDFTDATQRHRSFAVLSRLFGVGRLQLARRLGNRTKIFADELERLGLFKPTGHDDHRVVRLIVLSVEGPQIFDGHFFDVRSVADRRFAVVVPVERRAGHALTEDRVGRVLTPLELVPHDGHFRREVFRLDEAVDHPIGFEPDRERQVVIVGGERLVVVGPVEPRRPVELGTARLKQFRHGRMIERPFENHVFEQVSHPRLAITFVARANEDGAVHRDGRLRRIGEQQHLEAVVEPMFTDPFDGGDLHRFGRFRCVEFRRERR